MLNNKYIGRATLALLLTTLVGTGNTWNDEVLNPLIEPCELSSCIESPAKMRIRGPFVVDATQTIQGEKENNRRHFILRNDGEWYLSLREPLLNRPFVVSSEFSSSLLTRITRTGNHNDKRNSITTTLSPLQEVTTQIG